MQSVMVLDSSPRSPSRLLSLRLIFIPYLIKIHHDHHMFIFSASCVVSA